MQQKYRPPTPPRPAPEKGAKRLLVWIGPAERQTRLKLWVTPARASGCIALGGLPK